MKLLQGFVWGWLKRGNGKFCGLGLSHRVASVVCGLSRLAHLIPESLTGGGGSTFEALCKEGKMTFTAVFRMWALLSPRLLYPPHWVSQGRNGLPDWQKSTAWSHFIIWSSFSWFWNRLLLFCPGWSPVIFLPQLPYSGLQVWVSTPG